MPPSLATLISRTRAGNLSCGIPKKDEAQVNTKQKVQEMKEWKNLKACYLELLKFEAFEMVGREVGEPHKVYNGVIYKKNADQFTFNDFGKLSGQALSGVVFSMRLSESKGGNFEWLGVFNTSKSVLLNPKFKKMLNDETNVQVKLLANMTAYIRMYTACLKDTPPPSFVEELMGRKTVPTVVKLSTSPNTGRLNDAQETAVRYWVPNEGVTPNFMMLQGPPGTGKTTTAVEILHRMVQRRVAEGTAAGAKIVCAAPSWTAVYQYVSRFMRNHPDSGVVVAMTGCTDRTRTAADEPELARDVSVTGLLADITAWARSIDKPLKTCNEIMKKVKARAPIFYAENLKEYKASYEKNRAAFAQELTEMELDLKAGLLEEATVIFATLNALGAPHVTKALPGNVDTLIVDEAGQVADPDLFIGCALEPKRLLLIGDHRQLPPTVMSEKAKLRGLGFSSLERLYDDGGGAVHKRMLDVQYRMAPEILEWPNKRFYNGKLQTAADWHAATGDPRWEEQRYRVINVTYGQQVQGSTRSYSNPAEAACVVQMVLDLQRKGANLADVLIITPYSDQRRLLQRHVKNHFTGGQLPTISTVDGCQGAEREHVILSLVRTERVSERCFAVEPKHLCVALTRAMQTMTVVCNRSIGTASHLKSMLADADNRSAVKNFSERKTHEGVIVGNDFVSSTGVTAPIGELGYRVIDGDRVLLRMLPGSGVVVDVDLVEGGESPLRWKPFACQLVNDRNLCFHAPTSEDKTATLEAVRELAGKAECSTGNGRKVTVCDRQPADSEYLTLSVSDSLFAEHLIRVKLIRVKVDKKWKEVQVSPPQEPYYHNFVPLDKKLPTVRVPAQQVLDRKVTLSTTVMVQLVVDEEEMTRLAASQGMQMRDDVWYANICEGTRAEGVKQGAVDMWLETVEKDIEVRKRMLDKLFRFRKAVAPKCTVASSAVPSGAAFTIDKHGTELYDDALSCKEHSTGWKVTLHVADPTELVEAGGHHQLLQQRLTDKCIVDGHVERMMPSDVLKPSSLVVQEERACVSVTFEVAANGYVKKTAFKCGTVKVEHNLYAGATTTWAAFEESNPGEGPQLLRKAVAAMMQRKRYFEEVASASEREVSAEKCGPMHAVQYLVVRAKRAVAKRVYENKELRHHTLYDNGVPQVGRELSQVVGRKVQTEGELCEAILERVEGARGDMPGTLKVLADIAKVKRLQPRDRHQTKFQEGVSGVSFTSPLRKFGDYYMLRLLKGVLAKADLKCPSVKELFEWRCDEDKVQRTCRGIRDAVRPPKEQEVDVLVTDVQQENMELYCKKTNGLFHVPLPHKHVEAAAKIADGKTNNKLKKAMITVGSVLPSKLVDGYARTYVKRQAHHIAPYDKEKEVLRGVERVVAEVCTAQKKSQPIPLVLIEVSFAEAEKKTLQVRSQEEVTAALVKELGPDERYFYLKPDEMLPDAWFVSGKQRCEHRDCKRPRCTYYHGKDDPVAAFSEMYSKVHAAARTVSDSLGCSVNVAVPTHRG